MPPACLPQAVEKLKLDNESPPAGVRPKGLGMISCVGTEYVEFSSPLPLENKVEDYMNDIIQKMRDELRSILRASVADYPKKKREDWLFDWSSQLILVVNQIYWCQEVETVSGGGGRGGQGCGHCYSWQPVWGAARCIRSACSQQPLSQCSRRACDALRCHVPRILHAMEALASAARCAERRLARATTLPGGRAALHAAVRLRLRLSACCPAVHPQAFRDMPKDKDSMKKYNQLQVDQLTKLIEVTRGDLIKEARMKVMNMITIDAHSRDIVLNMAEAGVDKVDCFEWVCQLRSYWDPTIDDCRVKICDAAFPYGYEYLGNGPRLVITPLTDRIYITATQACWLSLGTAPAGPAGGPRWWPHVCVRACMHVCMLPRQGGAGGGGAACHQGCVPCMVPAAPAAVK